MTSAREWCLPHIRHAVPRIELLCDHHSPGVARQQASRQFDLATVHRFLRDILSRGSKARSPPQSTLAAAIPANSLRDTHNRDAACRPLRKPAVHQPVSQQPSCVHWHHAGSPQGHTPAPPSVCRNQRRDRFRDLSQTTSGAVAPRPAASHPDAIPPDSRCTQSATLPQPSHPAW